jgi:hypothetical protein
MLSTPHQKTTPHARSSRWWEDFQTVAAHAETAAGAIVALGPVPQISDHLALILGRADGGPSRSAVGFDQNRCRRCTDQRHDDHIVILTRSLEIGASRSISLALLLDGIGRAT